MSANHTQSNITTHTASVPLALPEALLEAGRIGQKRRAGLSEYRYLNHYACPCGNRWSDAWDCMCNDRCAACNKEIEPYDSDDLGKDETDAHGGALVAPLLVRAGRTDAALRHTRMQAALAHALTLSLEWNDVVCAAIRLAAQRFGVNEDALGAEYTLVHWQLADVNRHPTPQRRIAA